MKRILLIIGILVSLTAAQVVWAQTTEGIITYEIKVNLHRRLPPGQEAMKTMIPEFRTSKEQLFFNPSESLYKPLLDEETDEESGGHGGGGIQIRMQQPNNEVYFNSEAGRKVAKQEFMGKHYLIEDSVRMSPWKFGTETKTILGYLCKQAFYTDESQPDRKLEITAWYTDQLRAFLGPESYHTLPGAVLAVDVNNAERYIVATKVEARPLKKNEMKEPSTGQKISRDEYRKLVDEQMKKMRANGGLIIRN